MYTYAVDMWSCGCILAEMLGRNPLFPGKNFVHQLSLVFDVIGSPKDNEVTHIVNIEAKKFLSSQAKKPKVPFSRIYPDSSPICWELLDGLLLFDPEKRISIDQALKSSFLKGYYVPECQMFPIMSKEFEFSFERQNLTRYQLKSLIVAEVNSLKKEKGTVPSSSPPARLERSNSNIRQRPKESGKKSSEEENDNNSLANNSQQKGGAAAAGAGERKASYAKGTTSFNNRSYSAPRMRPSGATNTANPSNIPSSSSAAKQSSNLPSKVTAHQQHRNLSGINEISGGDENENDASSSIMKTMNRLANDKTTSNHEKMTIDKLLSQYSSSSSSSNKPSAANDSQQKSRREQEEKEDKKENSLRSSMRLSLDDENILSKYKKYEKTGAAAGGGGSQPNGDSTMMDIDRLQNLLPSQNMIQTPNKSLRLSSHQLQPPHGLDSNVENEIDDLLLKRFENSVLSSSQQHHQLHQNNHEKHQIRESLEKSRKEFVSSPTRQSSSSSSVINDSKKSIQQTYTSPKRLSRNKSFQSNDDNDSQTTTNHQNGGDYERKKNFPSLSSPNDRLRQSSSSSSSYSLLQPSQQKSQFQQQQQQQQSNPHNLSLLSSQERKDNDGDDDEEDLKTLRAKHAEKSKSSLSRSRDEAASRREEGQRLSNALARQSQEQLLLEQQQEERRRKETASPSVFRSSWTNIPVSSITGENNTSENNNRDNIGSSQLKKSTDRVTTSLTGGLISSRIVPHSYHINKIQHDTNDEDDDDDEDDNYRNRQKTQQEKRNDHNLRGDSNYDNQSVSSYQTRGNQSIGTAATTKYNLHQPVIPPPVQHQQHQNQPKETAVPSKNTGVGGEKRKITVPKSPRFSTMSWQRRHVEYNNEEKKLSAGGDGKKQRSVSVGKTRM
jgi:hypothetical protein